MWLIDFLCAITIERLSDDIIVWHNLQNNLLSAVFVNSSLNSLIKLFTFCNFLSGYRAIWALSSKNFNIMKNLTKMNKFIKYILIKDILVINIQFKHCFWAMVILVYIDPILCTYYAKCTINVQWVSLIMTSESSFQIYLKKDEYKWIIMIQN